jgi:hypothetical protein
VNNAIATIQIVWPSDCPGPASGTALSGAYAVQPEIGAPPSTKKARIIVAHDSRYTQYENMFRIGNAMSRAPIWSGMR